jgi:hypothetical protein
MVFRAFFSVRDYVEAQLLGTQRHTPNDRKTQFAWRAT